MRKGVLFTTRYYTGGYFPLCMYTCIHNNDVLHIIHVCMYTPFLFCWVCMLCVNTNNRTKQRMYYR